MHINTDTKIHIGVGAIAGAGKYIISAIQGVGLEVYTHRWDMVWTLIFGIMGAIGAKIGTLIWHKLERRWTKDSQNRK